MSDIANIDVQLNEIEQDRALTLVRYEAITGQVQSIVLLNKAQSKLIEARANIRTALSLAVIVGIVLACVVVAHFA